MKIGTKISKLWLKVFLFTLLGVFIIRCFFIQSYSVSSSDMETSLLKGDQVLVSKLAYGIRMPITPLTIPFTFDRLFGVQSYSRAIQFDYKRLFTSEIERNDIVLFNNPVELDKPLDKRSLLLSRCVGVGGDTIEVIDSEYRINGRRYIPSPNVTQDFKYPITEVEDLKENLDKLGIKRKNLKSDSAWIYLSMNRYESFLLRQSLKDTLVSIGDKTPNYQIVLPYDGMHIKLIPDNISLYKDIIMQEQGRNLRFENDKFYLDKQELKFYTFQNNYYWMLSDNVSDALDSRYLGFISEQAIIGKASIVWYSSGESGIRWNRIFSKIF